MSQHEFVANIYNPHNQSEQELLRGFTVRRDVYKLIFDDIKNSDMRHQEQHYIIQGQRGQGKTTLLLKLYYETRRNKTLNRFIIPLIFNEEQYHLNSLFGLWEDIAKKLEVEHAAFTGLADKIAGCWELEKAEYEAFKLLENALKAEKKKVILFIDNIGTLLDKFGIQQQQRLREVLIACPELRLIGASAVVMEHTFDYSKPFFEHFCIETLEGLSSKEVKTLLLNLGEHYKQESVKKIVKKQASRIEALRRLTGGVPRTMVLLFEIFVDYENGNAFKDLEIVLDRVTPLYKHRMDDLSPKQQAIMDAIALNWDAISTYEIAKQIRMESKSVSSQLTQLEKNGLITKIKTTTKNHLYQVTERFFNIWYLMRHGQHRGKNRVQWLVIFLQSWCSEAELKERASKHIEALRKGKMYAKHAFYMTEALARTKITDELQHELISQTRGFLESQDKSLLKELSKSDIELFKEAEEYYEKENYEASSQTLEKIKNKNHGIYHNLGLTQQLIGNTKKAEKYYLMAVEKGNSDAMYNLALMYKFEFKDYQKAEKYYLVAVEKGCVKAMYNLALMYEEKFKDYQKAEKYYLMAVEKGYVKAMYNLALMYKEKFKDYQKAEKYYLMAVENGLTYAMLGLAFMYEEELEDYQKAEKYYLMAAEKGDIYSMDRLAYFYFKLGNNKEKALFWSKKAFEIDAKPELLHTLSCILLWNNQIEEAIDTAKDFIEDEELFENATTDFIDFFVLLMAKKQYHATLNIFNQNPLNFKDRLKPVYYALMHFLKDDYPNEYRKMGPELKETVEEIIARVKKWEKEHA